MALTETIRRSDDPIHPGLIKQRFVPFEDGAGTYELVAAVAGKQIQIISFKFAVNVAGLYTLQTGADPIFPFPMTTTGGIFRDGSDLDLPIFCSNIGENMNIVTTAAPSVGGVYLQWREKA